MGVKQKSIQVENTSIKIAPPVCYIVSRIGQPTVLHY